MKNSVFILLKGICYTVALCSVVLLTGSCVHRGCTDPNATNYDSDATKDDGSCQYSEEPKYATLTIYRYNECYDGNVELYLDGVYQKTFNSYFNYSSAYCGENDADAISYSLLLGSYHFTAYSDSGEAWDFYANLDKADECYVIALKCGGYAEGDGVGYPANTGSLVVWSSFAFGDNIRVKVNGVYRGLIRGMYDATPGCGETDCMTIGALTPGIYTIDATNGTYSWNNYTVMVRDGWCNSFELK